LPEFLPFGVFDLEYLVRVVTGATRHALSESYSLILMPPVADPLLLDDAPLDGAILIDPVASDPRLAHLAEEAVPTITVGRDPASTQPGDWWVDNDVCAYTTKVLDHLAESGAERIALLTGPAHQSYSVDARNAFRNWTKKHGIEPMLGELQPPYSERGAYEAARSLLARPNRPTGVYAVLERLALQALAAAHDLGLRIPDDVRIAAGSDSVAARSAEPPLTALELNPDEIGRAAAEMLIARVEQREPATRRCIVPATLVVRGSTTSAQST
jgi:DNA-binding LacI/PurR family transcriptional regulator